MYNCNCTCRNRRCKSRFGPEITFISTLNDLFRGDKSYWRASHSPSLYIRSRTVLHLQWRCWSRTRLGLKWVNGVTDKLLRRVCDMRENHLFAGKFQEKWDIIYSTVTVKKALTNGAVESVGAVEALAAEGSDRIDACAEILAHRLGRFRALVHVCR